MPSFASSHVAIRLTRRVALCFLFLCATACAQSATRFPSLAIANRSDSGSATAPVLVAEPKQQGSSPFMPRSEHEVRVPVAVGGFCVVTLRDAIQWEPGREQHQRLFDGQLYWFASERERTMFARNPLRYVPALQGDCVVTFVETGERVRGDARHGILHDNRLYFFQSDAERDLFRAQPNKYSDADLANQGLCLVSQIDQQRQLPGVPETTVIVNGMRYRFVGVHQRQAFLANMRHYGVEPTDTRQTALASDAPRLRLNPRDAKPREASALRQSNGSKRKKRKILPVANRAMSGYCPVSIRDAGIWAPGEPRFQVSFEGQTYLMAGRDEQERFAKNPKMYAPAFGGKCIVSEIDEHREAPGSIYHAAQYEGRLYLFAGDEQKKRFSDNPGAYLNAERKQESQSRESETARKKSPADSPQEAAADATSLPDALPE